MLSVLPFSGLTQVRFHQAVESQPFIRPAVFGGRENLLHGLKLRIRIIREIQGHRLRQRRPLRTSVLILAVMGEDAVLQLTQQAMRKTGDRYAHIYQADFSRLKYVMICGCGFPNSKQNFEPAVSQFKLLFPNGHTILTVPESPMFNVPQAAVVTVPRLELVKEAGRQYAETGTIDEALMAAICSPMIPEEQYAAIVNAGA